MDDLGQLDVAGCVNRSVPFEIIPARLCQLFAPGALPIMFDFCCRQHLDEAIGAGVNRELGLVNMAEFVGAGIDVNQTLFRARDIDQGETAGGHFPKARADAGLTPRPRSPI